MLILKIRNITISKQIILYALISSVILVSATLFYSEERTSGMGYIKTFGFPKGYFQIWTDFKKIENIRSFKITTFLEDWFIYLLTSLIALLLIKKK